MKDNRHGNEREAEEEGTEIKKVVMKTLKFVKKSLKECKKKDFADNAHVSNRDTSLTAATKASAFYGFLAYIMVRLMMQPGVKYISITGKREAEEEGTEINKVVRKTLKFVKKSLKECKKKDFAGNAHVLRKKGRKY
ncbi:hypothetical protein Tco_0088629 [Tanacetum coccineum]